MGGGSDSTAGSDKECVVVVDCKSRGEQPTSMIEFFAIDVGRFGGGRPKTISSVQ
jgi:hypothetical protein